MAEKGANLGFFCVKGLVIVILIAFTIGLLSEFDTFVKLILLMIIIGLVLAIPISIIWGIVYLCKK